MIKSTTYLAICGLLFSFLACRTPDPNSIYGWTGTESNNPNASKILQKITFNNILITEFISFAGKLEQVNSGNNDVTLVEYSANKLTKLTTTNPATPGAKTILSIYFDNNGKITGGQKQTYLNNSLTENSISTLTYDTSGRITKHFQKTSVDTQNPNNFTGFNQQEFLYNGNNVTQATNTQGTISASGATNTTSTTTYVYENYDAMKNIYITLPKSYFIGMQMMTGASNYLQSTSPNNALKSTTYYPAPNPPYVVNSQYIYDSAGCPTSDPSGQMKIIYKPL